MEVDVVGRGSGRAQTERVGGGVGSGWWEAADTQKAAAGSDGVYGVRSRDQAERRVRV